MLVWPLAVAMLTAALACSVVADMCRDRFSSSVVRQMLFVVLLSAMAWCLVAAATNRWPDGVAGHVLRDVAVVAGGTVAVSMTWLARTLVGPEWRPSAARLWVEGLGVGVALLSAGYAQDVIAGWWGSAVPTVPVLTAIDWGRALLTALMLAAVARLFTARRAIPGFLRGDYRTISLAFLLAACAAGGTVPDPGALGGLDYAPLGGAIAGLLAADCLIRRRLLRMAPPSAEHVLEALGEAVVVLAPDGQILTMNSAARYLVAGAAATVPSELLLGRHVGDVLHPAVRAAAVTPDRIHSSIMLTSGLTLDVRAQRLVDTSGDELGVVVVGREVTALMTRLLAGDRALAEADADRVRLQDAEGQLRERLAEQERESSRLAEDASHDPLTGVHNRRHLESAIQAAIDGADGPQRDVAVVVIDVDHFKDVNDTYGHAVGDRVLQALARELQLALRRGETAVRYGGEEFVLVLPAVRPFEALRRTERLRSAIAAVGVPVRADGRGGTLSVTVSVGIGCYPRNGQTPRELLLAADTAMFSAKAAGRDCVVSA